MNKLLTVLGLTLVLVTAANGDASNSTSTQANMGKKWGATMGFGDPYPTLLGITGSYNITPNIRAAIGYGEIEVTSSISFNSDGQATSNTVKATTYSIGTDYLFLDKQFHPVVGVYLSQFNIEGDGEFSVQGFDKTTTFVYSKIGVEYLTNGGYNWGLGYNLALAGASSSGFYASAGYFF